MSASAPAIALFAGLEAEVQPQALHSGLDLPRREPETLRRLGERGRLGQKPGALRGGGPKAAPRRAVGRGKMDFDRRQSGERGAPTRVPGGREEDRRAGAAKRRRHGAERRGVGVEKEERIPQTRRDKPVTDQLSRLRVLARDEAGKRASQAPRERRDGGGAVLGMRPRHRDERRLARGDRGLKPGKRTRIAFAMRRFDGKAPATCDRLTDEAG